MRPRNAELSLLIMGWIAAVGAFLLVNLAAETRLPPGLPVHAGLLGGYAIAAHLAVRRLAPNTDPLILPIAMLLAGFGHAVVFRINPDLAGPQFAWIGIGIGMFVATLLLIRDHRRLAAFRYSFMLLAIGLLLLPLLPVIGQEIGGARLWVRIGPLNFQPAEMAKIMLAIFLAGYLAQKREVMTAATARIGPLMMPAPRHFGPLLLAWGLALVIMIWKRDLGSSVLFFAVFLVIVYVATSRLTYPVVGGALFFAGTWWVQANFAHVARRFEAWMDPFADIEGAGYQITQSLFAFGTGGISGRGLGHGNPELIQPGRGDTIPTDFIFSVVGEELGLLGTTAILLLFTLLIARGLGIALRARDPFGTLLAAGLTAVIGIQAFLIMAGVTRLIPLTGITLPFVAYGGSSLVANFVLIALLLRISESEAVRVE